MIKTFEHHSGEVRELRLDRPPANALSPELIAALGRAVEAAPRDGARALVLSGAPGLFSAGLDVPLLLTLDRPALADAWHGLYSLLRAFAASPIPIAAALTGHSPAGGTVLALFCDRRFVAAGEWKMGLNEVRVGLPLPPVIYQALRRQVGPREAERLAVGGLLLTPTEAVAAGLADELVPASAVVERAIEWCQSLTALPPLAMGLTRREARADLVSLFDRVFEEELPRVAETWWSAEAQGVLRGLVAKLAAKKKT
jgi:enoyl-CoA hydratase/carnithine racemase